MGGVNSVVKMSMGPALWIVDFALIYTLNPPLAAEMAAKWGACTDRRRPGDRRRGRQGDVRPGGHVLRLNDSRGRPLTHDA